MNEEALRSRHCFFAVWRTNTVHFQHDPVGRLLRVSAPNDTNLWLSSFEYDRWPNGTAVSDRFEHGRLVETTDRAGCAQTHAQG